MNSTAISQTLPDVGKIVMTDNPKALELAARLLQMKSSDLIDLCGTARAMVAREHQTYQRKTEDDRLVVQISDAILLNRIVDAGGRAIPHDEFVVEIKAPKTIVPRIDVLRRLEGKVPEGELRKALYITQPEPQWKSNATQLRVLERKYGGEIAEIINEGLHEEFGKPHLVFELRDAETNVTPLKAVK